MARGFAEGEREAFLLRLTYAHPFTARTRAWEGWAFFCAQSILKGWYHRGFGGERGPLGPA